MSHLRERYSRAKFLYETPSCGVMVFHDGTNALPELARDGLLASTLCYFTFSWFVSDKSLKHISERLSQAAAHMDMAEVTRRVRFLLNSRDEYDRARAVLPEAHIVRN